MIPGSVGSSAVGFCPLVPDGRLYVNRAWEPMVGKGPLHGTGGQASWLAGDPTGTAARRAVFCCIPVLGSASLPLCTASFPCVCALLSSHQKLTWGPPLWSSFASSNCIYREEGLSFSRQSCVQLGCPVSAPTDTHHRASAGLPWEEQPQSLPWCLHPWVCNCFLPS